MWAIQLDDGKRRTVYLREQIMDGRILVFEKEEAALRFMLRLSNPLVNFLQIKPRTIRFENKIKNESPFKVSDTQSEWVGNNILDFLH